jgi:hypothetical protein
VNKPWTPFIRFFSGVMVNARSAEPGTQQNHTVSSDSILLYQSDESSVLAPLSVKAKNPAPLEGSRLGRLFQLWYQKYFQQDQIVLFGKMESYQWICALWCHFSYVINSSKSHWIFLQWNKFLKLHLMLTVLKVLLWWSTTCFQKTWCIDFSHLSSNSLARLVSEIQAT